MATQKGASIPYNVLNKPVIGLDFGNYNSFPCFIRNINANTRLGGEARDLLPSTDQSLRDGIPSVYFYSKALGVLCGESAIRSIATPVQNRMRYLKGHLDESFTLDGKKIGYNEAITAVIQHCVRTANKVLSAEWGVTTNLVTLAYPTVYPFAWLQRLIELAEKATLEDGQHVKVVGTIMEPAAASLDFLVEGMKTTKETTVLAYDLGGGTFDLALVSAYPEGRKDADGDTYYYDIIDHRGLENVGGAAYDEIMYNLLRAKFKFPLKPSHERILRTQAEAAKIELSRDTMAKAELFYDDETQEALVSREEFERASRDLLMKTIELTQKFLADHPSQQPDVIVLTGGASQMPMVKQALEAALPQYKGKIRDWRQSRAIAYGAARFGAVEKNRDPVAQPKPIVRPRTRYDLGIRFFYQNSTKQYISTYVPAGTLLPFEGKFELSETKYATRISSFHVFEAKRDKPNCDNIAEDYVEIACVTLDHGREVPPGTESETRLCVDERGLLKGEARDPKDHTKTFTCTTELKNLYY